jgi:DNA-binding MarR family transcriptional regulator
MSSPVNTAASAKPTLDEVRALTDAVRELILRARHKHRAAEPNSEHGRLSVLFCLAKVGPVRASDLSKDVMLDLSTVSRHLRALETEGLVAKTADPDDKRAFRLELSEAGSAFVHEFWQARMRDMLGALDGWSPEEVNTLTDLLRRFVRDTEGCI